MGLKPLPGSGSLNFNKTLDNVPIVGTPQNPYNAALDRANGDQIRRHVAYSSVNYELPFGPGKKWATAKGPAAYVVGGWSMATILMNWWSRNAKGEKPVWGFGSQGYPASRLSAISFPESFGINSGEFA